MNAYYHEFNPGFNLWYVAVGVAVVVMIVLGASQYRKIRRHIVRQFEDKGIATVAAAISFVVGCMIIAESHNGIIQFMDNNLDAVTSPAWSVILLPVATLLAAGLVWCLLYLVGTGASRIQRRRLYAKLERDNRRLIKMQKQPTKPVRPSSYTGYYPSAQARRNRGRYERALKRQERATRTAKTTRQNRR